MESLSSEFLAAMKALWGDAEAAALAEALDDQPSVSVRRNVSKLPPVDFSDHFAGYGSSPVPWCPDGLYLDSRPEFILDPLLHAGAYYVQEAASMVYQNIVSDIISLVDFYPSSPLRVLDLCAAPGGKSTAILNALASHKDNYILVANEYDRARAGILRENLDKWGDPDVIVTSTDATSLGRLHNYFDIVAIDAPCSGEGMMRREPIARSQWSQGLVERCSALQKEIVGEVLPALRPGGFLIYSTCTFNQRENEDNCRFIEEQTGLEPVVSPRHFMPHKERCEGLFAAVFRKPQTDLPPESPRPKKIKGAKPLRVPSDVLFIDSSDVDFVRLGDRINALPRHLMEVFRLLESENIRIISAGTEIGTLKGDLLIPSSRQVLSYLFNENSLPVAELDKENALLYLRRNPPVLPSGTPKGFVAVAFRGFPLGLVKNIGNRANNLYPSEWRILK